MRILVVDLDTMGSPVTIKDVANRANVAISTVSRVLNGRDRVSLPTRRKVEAAIEELHFVHNPVAAAMITKRTHIVLVVVPDFINSFYSSIVQGIEATLKSHGYYAMVSSTGDEPHEDMALFRQKFDPLIDGAIIIPSGEDFLDFQQWNKPCVVVDRYIPGSGMHAVMADNFGGTYQLTQTLIDAGHRKIAIITGTTKLCVGAERLRGFRTALLDHGIAPEDRYIRCGSMYQSSGRGFFRSLMSSPDPPTAIVAGNNLICEGCLTEAKELGVRIGEDLSLVGFDDHLMAQISIPGVTVVQAPSIIMGKLAAKRLVDLLNGHEIPEDQRELILDVKLISRDSVKVL